MPRIILASASPQRRYLLEGLGVAFEVIPSTVDEHECPETDPVRRARILAQMKATEIHAKHPDAWIIGCDTLVVAPDGTLLEKPADAGEALTMMQKQSGGVSTVHSGLCLLSPDGTSFCDVSSSRVTFKSLSDAELQWWIETGLWEGRSGAFQIDGLGQLMIERIDGDWTGVVGLPIFLLGELAGKVGLKLI